MSQTDETAPDLLESYLQFCANPLRGREQVMKEFHTLLAHKMVTGIAFHNESVLAVGTKKILIVDPETDYLHVIGEFIIFLVRHRVGRTWQVSFAFQNTTNALVKLYKEKDVCCEEHLMHPHITGSHYHPFIDAVHGTLCIKKVNLRSTNISGKERSTWLYRY